MSVTVNLKGVSEFDFPTGVSSATIANGKVTVNITPSGSEIQGITISPTTPITGDTLRYNEYGDAVWDITCGVPPNFMRISYDPSQVGSGVGTISLGIGSTVIAGGVAGVAATATEPTLLKLGNSSASGSTSVLSRIHAGLNTTNSSGTYSLGTIRRWSARYLMNTTTKARFWLGLTGYNGAINTTAFVTDTPAIASGYALFRWSYVGDSAANIKAITFDGVTQNPIDTGVAPSTSVSKLFEIAWDGTDINFFIDGVLVAKTHTHIPATTTLLIPFMSCDNDNQAAIVTYSMEFMQLIYK